VFWVLLLLFYFRFSLFCFPFFLVSYVCLIAGPEKNIVFLIIAHWQIFVQNFWFFSFDMLARKPRMAISLSPFRRALLIYYCHKCT